MTYYDLYGTRTATIEELEHAVSSVLGIAFTARRNDAVGDYYLAVVDGEHFSIQPNYESDGDEEGVLETRFADYRLLLYVDDTERGDEIRDRLIEIPGLEHLRRDVRE
jgi:hypothetical protein